MGTGRFQWLCHMAVEEPWEAEKVMMGRECEESLRDPEAGMKSSEAVDADISRFRTHRPAGEKAAGEQGY